jgi:tol-pal system-associated acyl-CoA thioesterase
MQNSFIFPFRIYGEDTDALGIVHHPNYLKYMERARFEWINSLGYSLDQWANENIFFVINKADLHYISPLKAFMKIEVVSSIIKKRVASVVYEQLIRDRENPEKIYCKGLISVVCVNQKIQPRVFPKELLDVPPMKPL